MEQQKDENTVFIGKKEPIAYVLAVVSQFNNKSGDVVVKARGRAISKAVDVVEIVKNRFMPNTQVKDIKISTEEVMPKPSEENETSNRTRPRREGPTKVSAIEITLSKPAF